MNIRALILSGGVMMIATAVFAQGSGDAAYCKALTDTYRSVTGGTQNNQAVAEAMDQCAKGNTAAAIPVLEKALKDNKATLPPRS